jgi:hypothetical protein
MHTVQPPTSKRAVVIALVWIAAMVCLLAWMAYFGVTHIMASAG